MKSASWSSRDVTGGLKINSNSFNNWIREGFIKPTYPGKGTGTSHGWTLENLFEIELFRYLGDSGMALKAAAKIIKTHPFSTAEYIKDVVLPEHPHPERIQTEAPVLKIRVKDGKYSTGIIIGKTHTITPETMSDLDEIRLISLKKIERRIANLFK